MLRSPASHPPEAASSPFDHGGQTARLCRELDWAATPLGAPQAWSATLRGTVRLVLEAGLPNVLLWGPELIQIYNDAYAGLIGRKHPRALGRGNREVWPEVWHLNEPIYTRVFAGETITLHDALYPLERNGAREEVYLTISYSPVRDEAGKVAGVLANMVETTSQVALLRLQEERERLLQAEHHALSEARAARDHLSTLIHQAPVSMYIARGREHVYELVNDAWLGIVNRRRDEVVGVPARSAFPAVDESVFQLVDRVYVSGEPLAVYAQRTLMDRDRDGVPEEYFFNLVYQPLRDAAGQVYAMVVAATDVTELERARRDAELARAEAETQRERAEAANRAKTDFLSAMSHELRTPLNAIGGYVDLLDLGIHGPVTDAQRQALARLAVNQRHLLTLINDILSHARMEAGRMEFDLRPISALEAIDGVEPLVAPQARARGIAYSVEACDPELRILGDEERVRQILLNLVSNAIKFTAPGGWVLLSCEEAAGEVLLRVRDNGRGIPADKLDAIFDPFQQVGRSLNQPQEGVGLGLAISRDLARGMYGDLTVESVMGEGSTFTLRLPRAAE
ncbi:MAG TPA: ATP-binding protein [Longimicrobium sp.]|jgi:PAS domain S-box-containing protein|uniref:PAS domain-containing sensor histidine kinase n=1 Tax=Longimicrobium sp. TaxID=2029185 RepID=UPI002ED91051